MSPGMIQGDENPFGLFIAMETLRGPEILRDFRTAR
jgi:hypothetical protein